MRYVRILVPLSGGAADGPALVAARLLARRPGGEIEATLVPPPLPAIPFLDGVTGAAVGGLYEAAEADRKRQLRAAREAFEAVIAGPTPAAAGGAEPARCLWAPLDAYDLAALATKARVSDLTVIGRAQAPVPADAITLIETMLFETGRPLLITTPDAAGRPSARIAVAWNDSPSAARSVAAAMPLLEAADAVCVLSAGDGERAAGRAQALQHYLGAHGVAAECRVLPAGGGDGTALMAAALEARADLLVAGGYGHSRLREFVLGGVTRDLIERATLPVFLAH